jgi:WD40 repeat protein
MTRSGFLHEGGSQPPPHSRGLRFSTNRRRAVRLGCALAPGLLAAWCVLAWSGQTPAQERDAWHGHKSTVCCLVLSPDGTILASGSHDRTVRVWDMKTGKKLQTLEGHSNFVMAVAFSPDGMTLAAAESDRDVKLWAVDGWKERATLKCSPGGVTCLAYSHDGKTLAVAGWEPRGEKAAGVFTLWDVASGKARATLKGHDRYASAMAFSPDDQTLVTGGADGVVKLWDVQAGKERLSLQVDADRVAAVAFAPDGKTLATAGPAGLEVPTPRSRRKVAAVRLWDPATGKERLNFVPQDQKRANCLRYSPDGTLLAVGEGRFVELWDVAGYKSRAVLGKQDGDTTSSKTLPTAPMLLAMLGKHDGEITALTFSKDGKTLFTGDAVGVIKVWDVPEGDK